MSSESYDVYKGFPGGLDGKEFTCDIGDLGSIPGPERSAGEGNNVYNVLQFLTLHLWLRNCAAFVLNRIESLLVNFNKYKPNTWISYLHFLNQLKEVLMIMLDTLHQ